MNVARDTWYMVGRQARNLMREPIWIALLVIQPLVWLTLYGQLFSASRTCRAAGSARPPTSRSLRPRSW